MFFGPTINHPQLGRIRRGWGNWRGSVSVPGLDRNIEFVIEVSRKEPLDGYLQCAANLLMRFEEFKADFSAPLHEDYCFYKKLDIEEGGVTEDAYKKYLPVVKPCDVWNVLTPYHLWLGHDIDKYLGNAYLIMDVDWPNPHYFHVFMKLTPNSWQHMHTEFVG